MDSGDIQVEFEEELRPLIIDIEGDECQEQVAGAGSLIVTKDNSESIILDSKVTRSETVIRARNLPNKTHDMVIDFEEPEKQKIPVSSIICAAVLCSAGLITLGFGLLVMAGFFRPEFADRMWAIVILGLIMFIPGAYHLQIAAGAYFQIQGYSYDDISKFD